MSGSRAVLDTNVLPYAFDAADEARHAVARALFEDVVAALRAVALHRRERGQISAWDALIIVGAAAEGAKTVFSEDMDDGRSYSGVAVHNPFRAGR